MHVCVISANCQNLRRKCNKLRLHSYRSIGTAILLLYTNPRFNKQFVVFVATHVVMRQMEPVCLGEVMTSGGLSSNLPTCCLEESKLTAHTQAVSSISVHHHYRAFCCHWIHLKQCTNIFLTAVWVMKRIQQLYCNCKIPKESSSSLDPLVI